MQKLYISAVVLLTYKFRLRIFFNAAILQRLRLSQGFLIYREIRKNNNYKATF